MSIDILSTLRFEIIIALEILILLVLKLLDFDKNQQRFSVFINTMLLLNLVQSFIQPSYQTIFAGFFANTPLIIFEKQILMGGLFIISVTSSEWIEGQKDKVELFILLLTSLMGMFLMLSAKHILTLYLGLEMSTIPIAALSNFGQNTKKSAEAGIKLILSSAFSTGILLFGISMLYGIAGNLSLQDLSHTLQPEPLTILAFGFIISGFAFKMSVVPFHLWTADVYEGSPTIVTSFLASISKASVIFVMINLLYVVFGNLSKAWLLALIILSVLSMTIGNLFALRQNNIKRLLAFSSIAQVGFVLAGLAGASQLAATSVIYFAVIYILSNSLAFAVVIYVDTRYRQGDLSIYKGLYQKHPSMALILALSLFSLAGIPPVAGFFGKLFLLTAAMNNAMYVLLGFAAVNLVLSLYNYLRVVKIMFVDKAEEHIVSTIDYHIIPKVLLYVCLALLLTIGLIPGIYEYIFSLTGK